MNWTNVWLIFGGEIRDQTRDRRTMFLVVLLPLLMYPLLGMAFFQVSQFLREHPSKIAVIGYQRLPEQPNLLNQEGEFDPGLVGTNTGTNSATSTLAEAITELPGGPIDLSGPESVTARIQYELQDGNIEAAILFPADFAQQIELLRDNTKLSAGESGSLTETKSSDLPQPIIFQNSANEKSRVAYSRARQILSRWREELGKDNLVRRNVPAELVNPFQEIHQDVAREGHQGAAIWSKLLPFVLIVWALTGAFYPAVDLCAGEKERGTLETLLTSPAGRAEIVLGKLATVMTFSMVSALFNLLALGATGVYVMGHISALDPGTEAMSPPWSALPWLVAVLIPVAALFSALSLALAAFAKSSKEGQYYLMPLLMLTLPLMMVATSPAAEISLGTSLIPITGLMLMLRSVLEGNGAQALPFIPIVAAVTAGACLLAVRWAIDQFHSEDVLFRESEKFELRLWIRHLWRDRKETPQAVHAVVLGAVILLMQFFVSLLLPRFAFATDFRINVLVSQLFVIAAPALLFTLLLTRSFRQTLLLRMPPASGLVAAFLLAIAFHPVAVGILTLIHQIYPIDPAVSERLAQAFGTGGSWWTLLFAVAILPACCEELAFRGFILSGLRSKQRIWSAILVSSVLFGLAHPVVQQTISATIIGVLIAFLAFKSGSILPGLVFHMTHNALILMTTYVNESLIRDYAALNWVFASTDGQGYPYYWPIAAAGGCISLVILNYFRGFSSPKQPARLPTAFMKRGTRALPQT